MSNENEVAVIKPIQVVSSMLTATNIPENDYPVYDPVVHYALDARVIVLETHKVYQSLQHTNVGNPVTDTAWWVEVSPTNLWCSFDLSSTTVTNFSVDSYMEITPGSSVNSLSVINISGVHSIRVRVIDPAFGTVFDMTADLLTPPSEPTWYAWFFEPRSNQSQFVVKSLPAYPNAKVRLDFLCDGASYVGVIVLGTLRSLGGSANYGARLGIQDYSRKERDQWGQVNLQKRGFSKRMSLTLLVPTGQIDDVFALLAELTGTACLWLGTNTFSAMNVYGFINTFDILVQYPSYAELSLDLEGLI